MNPTNLNNIVEGETYYIQTQNYKFKAIYDKYEKGKFHFKKIIRLNTPKDWCGYIQMHEYMYYTIYESHKTKIQMDMETRAINKIMVNITGTAIY
jgi:biotin-(acetyl-CoA carboxylase) ligase